MNRILCCIVGLLMTGGAALADSPKSFDWPQWRGQDRNAISKESGLLKEWPKDGPPLAWKIDSLGGGYSAPSIAAGRLFGLSNRRGDEVVWALSESDGKEVWSTPLGRARPEGAPQGKEGPGSTPTVDGDRVYVLGAGGELACLQVKDGAIVWRHNLPDDFGGRIPMWRYTESPLVDGNKVICTPGGEGSTLLALDKSTGKLIWKCHVPDAAEGEGASNGNKADSRRGRGGFGGFGGPPSGAAYASALAIDFDGQRQYVQVTGTALVGVSASDGKLLWRYDRAGNASRVNYTTPIFHDGVVLTSSAYSAGAGAVRLTKDAKGAITAEEVYFTNKMQNHHGGMILVDGCLYGATGGNEAGMVECLDFHTGELLWKDRKAPMGSLAYADRRLYLRSLDGTMVLIEPNRERFVERGKFALPDRSNSPAWSHPVIANGRLYVRDQDVLLCYDVKAK